MTPPLLVLSLAFITGLLLPEWYPLTWHAPALMGLACFVFGLFESRLARWVPLLASWRILMPLPIGVIVALLLFGSAWSMHSVPVFTEQDAAWYNERGEVRIIGVIDRPPAREDQRQRFQVRVERLTPLYAGRSERSYPVDGLVLVGAPSTQDLRYGDRVRFSGKLETPPDSDDFSYRDYLARKNIYSLVSVYTEVDGMGRAGNPLFGAIYSLREQAYLALTRSIPQPEASLLAGILLGIETDMPDYLDRAFQRTGTSHIIAISGFNIAILSTLFCTIFLRFTSRLLAPFLAVLVIVAYTILVGAQASVVRAAIMGSIGLIGQAIGRRQAGATTLVFTAAVMCAIHPGVLSDAGFLLSFTAALGLILYAEPLQTWFANLASRRMSSDLAQRITGPVGEYFLFTAAAQVTTLPVILFIFGRLSVSSAVANPLILPAQPPVMILGGIAVMAGMALPQAGDLLAHLVTPLLAYTIRMVELLGQPAWSSTSVGEISIGLCGAYYLVLFGATIWRERLTTLLARLRLPVVLDWGKSFLLSPVMLVGLALLAAFTWRTALAAPDGRLHIAILPCGENAVVYLRAPGGQTALVGGGEKTRDLGAGLGRRLKPLYPHIDLLVVPNGDKMAAKGLSDLTGRITFEQVLLDEPDSKANALLAEELHRQGAVFHVPAVGEVFDLSSGAELHVLAHTESGTTVLLEYGSLRVLVPGGVSLKELRKHSNAIQPSLLVLSGRDLKETGESGWRQLEPLAIVAAQTGEGENWLNMDQVGWVQVASDGSQMWLEVEKLPER